MKFIPKHQNNEPNSLINYREDTEDPTWVGFIDTDQQLKKALLNEQGHICAYCQKRISLKRSHLGRGVKATKPMIEVEHLKSRDHFPNLQLDYQNMLGVCNGYTQGNIHCDKSKLEKDLLNLNPLDTGIESKLTYSIDGRILSKVINEDIDNDLNINLNLNCKRLKIARRIAIDTALENLKKQYPTRQWTKRVIQQEIDRWKSKSSDGKYLPFCQIAVWFLEEQKKMNRYPAS